MDKGDGTRFDRVGAVSQGNRRLVDRHATHGNTRHRDGREDALRVRGADRQEQDSDRQPEKCSNTSDAKPESAQRRWREHRKAHYARSYRSIRFRMSRNHRSEHARNARLVSQNQPSSGSGRRIHGGQGERWDETKPNPPELYDTTGTNAHDRAYRFIVQHRAVAATQIAQPPLAAREP